MGIAVGLLVAAGLAGAFYMGRDDRVEGGTPATAASGSAPAAPYVDNFLTGFETHYTQSQANERNIPAPKGSRVLRSYGAGVALQGRWVKGVTPGTRWLKTSTGYVWEGNLVGSAVAPAAYVDRFISGYETAYVVGRASERNLPSPDGTRVLTQYSAGAELFGRWVAGVTPGTKWFKTDTGYVWEGNLVRD